MKHWTSKLKSLPSYICEDRVVQLNLSKRYLHTRPITNEPIAKYGKTDQSKMLDEVMNVLLVKYQNHAMRKVLAQSSQRHLNRQILEADQ